MEFSTSSLDEVISMLDIDQKEEINIIKTIVDINKENKENAKEKVFNYIEEQKPENCIRFIFGCIDHAAKIRPKERESFYFLSTSILDKFNLKYNISENFYILRCMFQVKGTVGHGRYENERIFDFAEEGTIEKTIFDDDIELLRKHLANKPNEGKERSLCIRDNYYGASRVNRIEFAAYFGSIKCFKILMMDGDEIDEEACKYAVMGGNSEIIHLCEQKGLQFEDCLRFSASFHHFELFEWLNMHFNYENIPLTDLVKDYNELLVYFYCLEGADTEDDDDELFSTPLNLASSRGQLEIVKYLADECHAVVEAKNRYGSTPINTASQYCCLNVVKYLYETCYADAEAKDKYQRTPLNNASEKGHLEVVKYLYETCHATVETQDNEKFTPVNRAVEKGHLEVVKYLCETCHANVEIKNNVGKAPINNASSSGKLEAVKCLYETCHANVETKDDYGWTPINIASWNGHLEVVKYLYETCHADVEAKNKIGRTAINCASLKGYFEIVKYLYETCHADVETKDEDGYTPINYASKEGNFEVVKYLYETCHANVEVKNEFGRTPISYALRRGCLEIVKYLYETCHASVETKDNDGNTLVNYALSNKDSKIVKYLYEACHANAEIRKQIWEYSNKFYSREKIKYIFNL